MSSKFDFREQAGALLKRLSENPSGPMNKELVRTAIELALKEAYACGVEDGKRRPGVPSSPRAAAPASSSSLPARTASRAAAPVGEASFEDRCAHEWEDVFLDGRALGARCVHCEILQTEVQERCNHYFVAVDGREVCVACRKPRGKAR